MEEKKNKVKWYKSAILRVMVFIMLVQVAVASGCSFDVGYAYPGPVFVRSHHHRGKLYKAHHGRHCRSRHRRKCIGHRHHHRSHNGFTVLRIK